MFEPSPEELEEVRRWLWENPPDGKNRVDRRKRMAVVQNACDQLEPATYLEYVTTWNADDSAATALEEQHPALHYLRKATAHAMADLSETKVERGVAAWHTYNAGYVFRTPDLCFGIDIHMRGSEQLADELDFLLISHAHQDHSSAPLMDAMVTAKMPVLTRWQAGTTIISEPCEFQFGPCRVKVDIGDHHFRNPDELNNMLMFQVDCGESAYDCTIYHSGDGSNFRKMVPDREVDVLIVHADVGMSVEEAIGHLRPQLTLASHVLELGHRREPPQALRWSFDYAFERIRNVPESAATVLTWGERWLLPGTVLRKSLE